MSTILEQNKIQRAIRKAMKTAQQSGKLPVEARTLLDMSEQETVDITPKKGVDYFTQEDIDQIVKMVLALIPTPKDGKDGKDAKSPVAGTDYPTVKQIMTEVTRQVNKIQLPVPKDGYTPIKGVDYFTPDEQEQLKNGIIEAVSPLLTNLEAEIQQKIDSKPSVSLFSGKKGGGGNSSKYRTVTSDTTIQARDEVVFVDASGGAITVTLPGASSAQRREYHIKKIDSSTNAVTIATQNSETIDGEASISINQQYTNHRLYSTGGTYYIL